MRVWGGGAVCWSIYTMDSERNALLVKRYISMFIDRCIQLYAGSEMNRVSCKKKIMFKITHEELLKYGLTFLV